ncbi:MAG: hypothetical protein ABI675_14540 [Chitinophagaceae bacterium]
MFNHVDQVLTGFLAAAAEDPRISTAHISLYVSLWKLWKDRSAVAPLYVYSHEVMAICKISSYSTYHKTIRQLQQYGFILYEPSFNQYIGSKIEFIQLNNK